MKYALEAENVTILAFVPPPSPDENAQAGNRPSARSTLSAVAGACHGLGEAGGPAQYVVCGMETHVCVMQTVIELLELGKKVFVVEEAVGSRRESDKALALARMRAAGASIVSREMVAFEWLRRADSELFREISRNFLR